MTQWKCMKIMNNMEDKDQVIDELLKKVAEKKSKIGSVNRFQIKTNATICFDPVKNSTNIFNLHTMDENSLMLMLNRLEIMESNMQRMCDTYGLEYETFTLHGYKLEDWQEDVMNLLQTKRTQRKLKELKVIEDKLSSLMSQEKKEMIEILAIMKLLS